MAPATVEKAEEAYNQALNAMKLSENDPNNAQKVLLAGTASTKALLTQTKLADQTKSNWCHWFCDEKWRPLAANALFVLSLEGTKQASGLYEKLALVISKCPSCSAFYHLEFEKMKIMLKEKFKIDNDKINAFERSVRVQDKDRLMYILQGLSDRKKLLESSGNPISYEELAEFFPPVVESLYCPWLFAPLNLACASGDDDLFFIRFRESFLLFDDSKHYDPIIIKTQRAFCLSAGILFFNSDPRIHQLSKAIIMRYTCIAVDARLSRSICLLYPFLIPKIIGVINDTALQVMEYMGPINPPPLDNRFSDVINVNHPSMLYLLNVSYFIGILHFCHSKDFIKLELNDILDHCDNYINLLRNCLSYSPNDDSSGKFRIALSGLDTLLSWKPFDLKLIITKLAPVKLKDIAQNMMAQSVRLQGKPIVDLSSAIISPAYDNNYEFSVVDCYNWLNAFFKVDKSGQVIPLEGEIGQLEPDQSTPTPKTPPLIDESDTLNICSIMLTVLDRHISSLPKLNSRESLAKDVLIRRLLTIAIKGLDFPKSITKGIPTISEVSRLMRTTIRNIIDKASKYILESRKSRDLLPLIHQLIRQCIEFDIISASTDITPSSPPGPTTGLWQSINRRPIIFDETLTTALLKSLKLVTFAYDCPTKSNETPSQPEPLSLALESLRIVSEMDPLVIRKILQDREILVAVFLSSFSGYSELSDMAIDVICQASDETSSRSTALKDLLRLNPILVIQSFTEAVDLVRGVDKFSPCAKLIKVSQDFVDALYSPHGGVVDADFKSKLSSNIDENELLQYWLSTWKFLQFTFRNTRIWGEKYLMSAMKDFFREEAHYCQMLLDQFRLFEVDLPVNDSSSTTSNGERLALPVASTIELMCDLLRLRDTELLDACFRNILSIIELMKSFNVKLPDSLVEVFKRCSSGKITNKLSQDNISQLLAALSSMGVLTDADIESIQYEAQARMRKTTSTTPSISPSPSGDVSTRPPSIASTGGSKLRQRTLLDIYEKTADGRPPPIVVQPHSRSIQPSATQRTSAMDLLRESVKQNRMSSAGGIALATAAKAPLKEIHPPRPPGFNSRRTTASSSATAALSTSAPASDDISEPSDVESDDDDLFTERKSTSAISKIRNINRPGFKINTTNMSRKGVPSLAQKELEKKLMQQRLNIDLGPLHKEILSWNYHSSGPFPPSKVSLKSVVSRFASVEEYQQTFKPLLMLECWQGIQKVKEENVSQQIPFKIQVGKRVTCDAFSDVYVSIATKDFNDIKIGEADLIVLSYFGNSMPRVPRPQAAKPNCLARVQKVTVQHEFVDLLLRTYQPGDINSYLGQNFVVYGLKASR